MASDRIDDIFQVPQAPGFGISTEQSSVPQAEVVDGDVHQGAPERKAMITEDLFQDGAAGQNAAQQPSTPEGPLPQALTEQGDAAPSDRTGGTP